MRIHKTARLILRLIWLELRNTLTSSKVKECREILNPAMAMLMSKLTSRKGRLTPEQHLE